MNQDFLELDSAINDACAPIFNLLAGLTDPSAVDDLDIELRQSVEATFIAMERRFFEIQLTVAIVHDIKYAMAAYADEMVMSSRWQGKYDWMTQPLVVQYFGDTCAGIVFFQKLEQHKQDFKSNLAVIQLYYSVLQFGFQGQYRLDGYEKLQAVMNNLQV
ncbi:DotU family type IV/VI secretion system protein, partial [Reinekea sp.]